MTSKSTNPAQILRSIRRANASTLPHLTREFAEKVQRARASVLDIDKPLGHAGRNLARALMVEGCPNWELHELMLDLAGNVVYRALVDQSRAAETQSEHKEQGLARLVNDARIFAAGRLAGRAEVRAKQLESEAKRLRAKDAETA